MHPLPRTNEQGETGIEVFKRLAAQPPKAGRAQKAGQARQTSWDSQEEWNRDQPTVKLIFPFIDKNSDGKIDSDEYQAIHEYKKKHRDWQDRARKALGVTPPEDQKKNCAKNCPVSIDIVEFSGRMGPR